MVRYCRGFFLLDTLIGISVILTLLSLSSLFFNQAVRAFRDLYLYEQNLVRATFIFESLLAKHPIHDPQLTLKKSPIMLNHYSFPASKTQSLSLYVAQ